jgi:tetratricopeptide (TPR) repeat protein
MAQLVALTCPVCGAPFAPESDRCGYCGSIVVLKTDHSRIDPRLLNKLVIDEHIAEYRKVVRIDANDATAHYGLGVAYFNLGLIDEKVDELTQAARLMPENPNIQSQLAVALREATRRGNPDAWQDCGFLCCSNRYRSHGELCRTSDYTH